MSNQPTLSFNAQILLDFLKQGPKADWECMNELFPKPKYPSPYDFEGAKAVHQHSVNIYGNSHLYDAYGLIEQTEFPCYDRQTSEAYQELKAAGLAKESNNGYNCYTFSLLK